MVIARYKKRGASTLCGPLSKRTTDDKTATSGLVLS